MIGLEKGQFYGLLICLAIGCVLGLLYAILGPVRRCIPKWIGFFIDIAFWVLAGLGYWVGTYLTTMGALRAFCLFSMAAGGAIAACGPGRALAHAETKALCHMQKLRRQRKTQRETEQTEK